MVGSVGARLGRRTVVAHLGSGASLVALLDGAPVDTTMSLTPGGGLVMATRSGDLDPGVVLHLLDLEGTRPGSRRCSDTRVESAASPARRATSTRCWRQPDRAPTPTAAIDAFVGSVAKHVAAFVTVLDGLDMLVFTGGIGARSAPVRAAIAARIGHIGVAVDAEQNESDREVISPPAAPCAVLVVPTDEESVIASQSRGLLGR